jgi:hypothetical protein
MKATREATPAMATKHDASSSTYEPARSGRYEVRLASRDGKVVYAKSMTQKRILESAERIIAKAHEKIGK